MQKQGITCLYSTLVNESINDNSYFEMNLIVDQSNIE